MSEDPYYEVRDGVKQQIDGIKTSHTRLQDMVRSADSSATQIKEVRRNLVMDIRAVDKDFKVLKASVGAIEKDRAHFANIKEAEFEARKAFVNEVSKTLKIVKAGVESEAVKRKMDEDASKAKYSAANENYAALSAGIEKNNSRFIENQQLQAKEMINMQDEALEALGQGVDRLNDLGSAINVELKDQEKMLGGLSGDMDEAEGKMNMVNHYLKKLLNTKDSCQYGTIVVLGKCMAQFSHRPSHHLSDPLPCLSTALVLIALVACIIWLPGNSTSK